MLHGYEKLEVKKIVVNHQKPLDTLYVILCNKNIHISNLQGNNWLTVGQYDSKTKEITLRRDPVFSGGVTLIPEKGRPTYKIAAFFPVHEDLGPLKTLGNEWQAAFRVAVELVNSGPFKVAFTYVLADGGYDSDSCRREAEVGGN